MRLGRHEYFIEIAKLVAKRSTCERAMVGAVLVNPDTNHLVSTGYNGSIPHTAHCTEIGCLLEDGHCRRTVHAELNALLHLERSYPELVLYCTHQPCYQCFKALATANVKTIYYMEVYEDKLRDKLAWGSNVIMKKIK